jgi:hypothetical protein
MRQKTGGRQKGTPNKTTSEARDILKQIIFKQIESLESDLEAMQPAERLAVIVKLIPYAIPKLKDVSSSTWSDPWG